MGTLHRLPVTLNDQDNELVIVLRAALERRLKKRVSVSELVRISLRTQAKLELDLAQS